jgi:hypothetical protein
MNLYKENNAFYDWLETNPLATSGIVLWHALMHIANKAGWPDKFAVAVSVLEVKTGLKKDAIYDARNKLVQLGRIRWESRRGNQSALYEIIPFYFDSDKPTQNPTQLSTDSSVSDKPTQIPIQSPTQYPTRIPTQQPTINILDNTREKDKKNNTIPELVLAKRAKDEGVDNSPVCPKCGGKGYYITKVPYNNGLDTKDSAVTCECRKKRPPWAVEVI